MGLKTIYHFKISRWGLFIIISMILYHTIREMNGSEIPTDAMRLAGIAMILLFDGTITATKIRYVTD